MLACRDPTGLQSARLITGFSAALTALPFASMALGITDCMGLLATVPNLYLLAQAWKFHQDRTDSNARRVFFASLGHLILTLSALVWSARVCRTVHQPPGPRAPS